MPVVSRAVIAGMLVMLAGTIPRNILFAANLRYVPAVPWAVPLIAAYLVVFWRYLNGAGEPASTSIERRESLRAHSVSRSVWAWALTAGGLGIVALVLALRVANRIVTLPQQTLPDLTRVPRLTVFALLLMSAPVAGIVEEAAFRGYMQGPIARRYGIVVAILVTGTMFAVAHLDFTPVLWPYYVAVSAIYGVVTHLSRSILPAVVLHTLGNTYSNLDLLLHGQAEWQSASTTSSLVRTTGVDVSFQVSLIALTVALAATLWSFRVLSRVTETPLR